MFTKSLVIALAATAVSAVRFQQLEPHHLQRPLMAQLKHSQMPQRQHQQGPMVAQTQGQSLNKAKLFDDRDDLWKRDDAAGFGDVFDSIEDIDDDGLLTFQEVQAYDPDVTMEEFAFVSQGDQYVTKDELIAGLSVMYGI